jgi:hypothetical protein
MIAMVFVSFFLFFMFDHSTGFSIETQVDCKEGPTSPSRNFGSNFSKIFSAEMKSYVQAEKKLTKL